LPILEQFLSPKDTILHYKNHNMENEFSKHRKHDSKNNWNDPEFEKRRNRGRVFGGLILIAGGALWLAKSMGALIPAWIFSWPAFLIFLGLYLLGKNGFKRPGGLIVMAIGGVFLVEQNFPSIHIRHIVWPTLIILAGALMIFNPFKKWKKERREEWSEGMHLGDDNSTGDYLDVNSVFGGVEKNIISKNFKGGEVNCVFGGAEINLSQSDIQGTVMLDVNAIFGGMEIIVPSNWRIKSEITAVLGGVSDKRPMQSDGGDESKVLIMKGNAVFGGVEIKSYI